MPLWVSARLCLIRLGGRAGTRSLGPACWGLDLGEGHPTASSSRLPHLWTEGRWGPCAQAGGVLDLHLLFRPSSCSVSSLTCRCRMRTSRGVTTLDAKLRASSKDREESGTPGLVLPG